MTEPGAPAPVVLLTGVLRPRRGMEVAVLELAAELARERPVEIVLVHGQDPGDAPVPVTALPPSGVQLRARALRAVLARRPEAVVVACGVWATAYLAVVAREALPRAVGWEHSLTAARLHGAGPRTRVKMHLAGRAYRRSRAVVAVGDEVAATLRRVWGVEARVVPNLLPATSSVPATSTSSATVPAASPAPRHDLDGRDGRGGSLRLLAVGALVPVKSYPLALRTLALLPDAVLTVAGDGPQRERLQVLARELGLADRVTWLGHVDRVEELMAAADVLLAPSASETFAYTLLEAGAAHLPVVAVDVPVVRDVVPSLAPGVLVPEPDPRALAAAVREALEAAPSWDFRSADARRAARFGREEVLAQWRQVLG